MGIEFEELSNKIIGAAIDVHKELGPGFLESIYENALSVELKRQGIRFERQKEVKVYYAQELIGIQRIDMLVEKEIIVELKAIKNFEDVHFAQIKSYLKATNLKIGLLLNFAKTTLEIKRIVL